MNCFIICNNQKYDEVFYTPAVFDCGNMIAWFLLIKLTIPCGRCMNHFIICNNQKYDEIFYTPCI